MRNSERGFTLLEVLGAVAILAILYTTLATVAIRGLRSEGESRRMLEASLMADWEFADFEMQLENGVLPEIGVTEYDDEAGYKLVWEVFPLQTSAFDRQQGAEGEIVNPLGAPAQTPDSVVPTEAAPRTAPAGAAPAGGEAPAFYEIVLTVSWMEGGGERAVTRTTFAVDSEAAAKLAAASVLESAQEEGRSDDEDEDERP